MSPQREGSPAIPLPMGEIPWIIALATAAALAALLEAPIIVRTLLGLPFVLFIPGYLLVITLFPTNRVLDGSERLALAFGLSLALIPLVALGIEYSPWDLARETVLAGMLGMTLLLALLAVLRRARLPLEERFRPSLPVLPIPPLRTWDRTARTAALIGGLSLLLLAGSGAVLVAGRLGGEPMTEFALLTVEGKSEFYPRAFEPGVPRAVMIEITNREEHAMRYSLRVVAEGRELGSISEIRLADGQNVRQPIDITLTSTGERIPIELELYDLDQPAGSAPYRSLRFVVSSDTTGPDPTIS